MSGTDYTLTTTLGLYKPIANRAVGLWGDLWNTNADAIDAAIHFASGGGPYLPLAGNATVFGPATFSGALNYTATGGSVARAAQSRAADVANVLDFGADPTGVADSTSAIRAALAATPRRNVYLPAGNYRITDSLTVGAGPVSQRLYGDGQSSVLLVNTDFSLAALGVVILTGRQSQLATHPVVEHFTIQFAVPTDITATLASASGTTLTLTAPVPAGVVVGDYVTDDTDWSGIQKNSDTRNSVPPVEGSKVIAISGNQVTLSLPVVAAHIAAGHSIRFAHTRSMFRNLGAAPPPSTGVGGYGAKYPWAIYATSCGVPLINDIKINGAWNGIYMHPAAEGGNFRIQYCPIGAMNVGIDIDEGADGGFLEDCWFNAFGIYVPAFLTNTAFGQVWYDGATIAWSIGKTDGIFMSNMGSFNCTSEIKPTWTIGQLVNIDQDFPSAHFTIGAHAGVLQITNFRGQKITAIGGATFSNCLIDGSASAVPFLDINGSQPEFDQCSIIAPVPGGIVVRNGGTPHMRGCVISGPASNWSGGLVQVQAGSAISLMACEFVSAGAGPGLTTASDSVWSNVISNFWGNSTFTPPGPLGKYEPGLPAQQGAMAAAGTTQATATPINSYFSNFTTVPAANNGCILPAWAARGSRWTVFNNGTGNPINVYPPLGFDLGVGINLPLSLPVGMHGTWIAWDSSSYFPEYIGQATMQLTGGNIAGTVTVRDLGLSQVGSITAAGTTQGTATALTAPYSNITTAPVNSGVILPATPPLGVRWVVWNHGANPLNLYPAVGHNINTIGINAPLVIAANTKAALVYWGGIWLQED